MALRRLAFGLAFAVFVHAVASQDSKELKIADCSISLLKDSSVVRKYPATFPTSALKNVELGADHTLEVKVDVKDASNKKYLPQQIMLLLTSQSASAYLIGKKGSANTIQISQAALEKQIGKQGGQYEIILLLGDPAAPAGLTWKLGSIMLKVAKEQPEAMLRSVLNQQHVFVEPEIIHQFRPAEPRPPVVLSLAFAVLPFVLLVGLVVAQFAVVKTNFKAYPSGAGSLWALLFHGGLAAMLALYVAFWVKLNLAQTLPIATVIGVFITATGFKTLQSLADARIAESRKKKE